LFRRGFKTWCETVAEQRRRALSVSPTAALDPTLVAKDMGVAVVYIEQLPNLDTETLEHLTIGDPDAWSAVTVCAKNKYLIVLNSAHPKTRQANSLMHELAHIIIGHKPARLDITPDGMMILSSYDKNNEDEANWLAAALLVPREALLHARKRGFTNEEAANHYGCSVQLFTFRVNTTGVDVQLRRRRNSRG
jgi:Zn-dependent peptidase ImmA (M78 family)